MSELTTREKRQLLADLFAGKVTAKQLRNRIQYGNSLLIGFEDGDQVRYNDDRTGEEITVSKPEFDQIAKDRFALLIQIAGTNEVYTSEAEIPDDI